MTKMDLEDFFKNKSKKVKKNDIFFSIFLSLSFPPYLLVFVVVLPLLHLSP